MGAKRLNAGDRIRLKVRTIGGWKGKGTVLTDQENGGPWALVRFRPDDGNDWSGHGFIACRFQVAKLRDQSPAPTPPHP